jgi:hypothetical protein
LKRLDVFCALVGCWDDCTGECDLYRLCEGRAIWMKDRDDWIIFLGEDGSRDSQAHYD